jgi:UTP--glucose-1-phosphate uridylyltransferase
MLPITKTVSKEMLPLVDKPIIQTVIEELVDAGITDIIIVTAAHKSDLADYFGETEAGLAAHLQAAGPDKAAILDNLERVRNMARFAFIEQKGVYGTGTPVLCAEPYIGGEPFIYTFADDFFVAENDGKNSFKQLIDVYDRHQAPVIATQHRGEPADYTRYGYVGGAELSPGVLDVRAIVEQPAKYGLESPGDQASIGGFVVTPDVFTYLHRALAALADGKELFFNTALSLMLADGKQVLAREITGATYYDTGNKLEYMKTAVAMAARHPEIGAEFRQYVREFSSKTNEKETYDAS